MDFPLNLLQANYHIIQSRLVYTKTLVGRLFEIIKIFPHFAEAFIQTVLLKDLLDFGVCHVFGLPIASVLDGRVDICFE